MVANDLRLDIDGINAKVGAEMHPNPQAVEKVARREHPIMAGDFSCDVGERIRRISDGDKHCLWSSAHDFRLDAACRSNRDVINSVRP